MNKTQRKNTLLIVPVNDLEAFLIAELGERIKMQVYRSEQPHGAKLGDESNILETIKKSICSTVIIVEMPGPEIEKQIQALGKELKIIDHHSYTDLDRARDAEGMSLPSSLEQFLELAGIDDKELDEIGYKPRLVRATGLWDAGYIWALIDNGYTTEEIEEFEEYKEVIDQKLGSSSMTKESKLAAELAWKAREEWKEFWIFESADMNAHIRSLISRMAAKHFKKPTPVIILERAGRVIYVQETPRASDLFDHFGGFTFGKDHNWGYDNEEGEKQVGLDQIKEFLT